MFFIFLFLASIMSVSTSKQISAVYFVAGCLTMIYEIWNVISNKKDNYDNIAF